jgi:hypothetical protein
MQSAKRERDLSDLRLRLSSKDLLALRNAILHFSKRVENPHYHKKKHSISKDKL